MKFKNKAFTLFELLVVISIIMTLMIVVYLPYSHYQNKAKLKLVSREISQSFYEARNMAVSGIKDITGNRSIGLYFSNQDGSDDKIIFFSYPHNIDTNLINNIESSDVKIIKTNTIQDNINIDYLDGYDNLLFFFNSISGESSVYTFTSSGKNIVNKDKISIKFSYKKSMSETLRKELIYYKDTNIIDYK
ncbi:type II secretion system protein [Candidatus Gracilibacteria bacterium]|nr:type II secretion system protein [Candidatus Gracilibacteria bacterium]